MKKEEVPQDLRFFEGTVVRDITYAIDDEGNYTSVISDGWEVKNDALDLTWSEISEECEKLKQEVLAGKQSPLQYHMEKNLMSLNLLSTYTGFSKRIIKKHFDPDKFNNLNQDILQKYADVLRISVEELKTV